MSDVAARLSTDAPTATRARKYRLSIAETAAEAAMFWDALAAQGGGSAYQSRAFLEPWIAHVAPAQNVVPRLGLVRDQFDAPVALLPFGIGRRGPLKIAVYLGGRDSNLNMPLLAPGRLIGETDARALLQDFANVVIPRPDLFVLSNASARWTGCGNPFVLSSATPAPSAAFGAQLGGDIAAFLARHDSRDARKKLKSKTAKLAALGTVASERIAAADAPDILAVFVAQKEQRLAERGIDAGFGRAHMSALLADLGAPSEGAPAMDLYVLRVGKSVAAIFGGLPHGSHWHGFINSYTDDSTIARCSPGDILLRYVLGDLVQRGITSFDLGIGEARYKAALCDETIALFDTIVPLTPLGHACAWAETARLHAKRRIKQTPWAIAAVRRMQALFAGR